ncbi:MAG: hypothetical protein OEX19_06840 [Gammaproteobacteria bacterium]|nr:hypothetical protein [Gammaproteobacteria bacterium]
MNNPAKCLINNLAVRFSFTIILCVLFNLSVQAEDDCVRALPKPIVKTDSKRVTNYSMVKTDHRNIEERFTLDKTNNIRIKQFGCAHFGVRYAKKINEIPGNDNTTLKYALAFIEELKGVAYFQLRDAEKAIRDTIEKGNWKPGEPITVIEGYEWVVVEVAKDKQDELSLQIGVDIAL